MGVGMMGVKVKVGDTITRGVTVERDGKLIFYEVEYDANTNMLKRITHLGTTYSYPRDEKIEISSEILKDMIEILKTMELKLP
jgi:pyruvate formate-lyase activating enzyme-like uncharacterized protein